MPPVTERTMFPYRKDEARRERAAARQEQQYDPQQYDTSTYPPSPWPAGPGGRAVAQPDRSAQTYPGGVPGRPVPPPSAPQQGVPQQGGPQSIPRPPQGRGPSVDSPSFGGPYQTGSFPVQSTSGSYPAPPRPGLTPTRGSAAAAPSWVPQAPPTPAQPPAQPVPARPGQSRGAQARVAQAGSAPAEAPRSPWPAQQQQARGAYPGEQARPAARPGPRWEPDHTGQTGPHTWPPIAREAAPGVDEATQLASVQDLRPKPALPPQYEDRPLDQNAGRRGRPLPGGGELTAVGYDEDPPVRQRDPRTAKGGAARKKGARPADQPRAAAREVDLDGADLATANYGADFAADYSHDRAEEHAHEEPAERSLLSAWLVFLLETVFAAAVGLSAWIGFHHLWRTQPLIAAGGCGVVLVGMHAVVGFIRRRQTGHAMDLFSSCVVVAVGVAITVLPAAFAIKPL
jgi:hypothetical protein